LLILAGVYLTQIQSIQHTFIILHLEREKKGGYFQLTTSKKYN